MKPALREYWKVRDSLKLKIDREIKSTGFDSKNLSKMSLDDFAQDFIAELAVIFNDNPILRKAWSDTLKTIYDRSVAKGLY